jgi:hypothetical protein
MAKLMKRLLALIMVGICTVGFALPACAQATLDDILKRVEALERENASLKAEVMALKEKPAMPAATAQVAAAPAAATPAVNFLKTKLDVEMYGFIMAQGSYADSDMASSNAPRVAPKENGSSQSEFGMAGNDTRLGFNVKGPDLEDGGKVSGKIEIDFANSQTATYTPRLRHAYVQLDYPKWAVNAGQNWDIFAPINPSILNPDILWGQGNVGYRHPQVHIVNKWGDVWGGKLTSKTGILDTDDVTNENSGVPVLATYTGYETKIMGMPATFGVSGLLGEVEASGDQDHSLWAVAFGMTLKMTDWLAFKAEGFSGAKLDDFLGGSTLGMTSYLASGLDKKPFRVKGGFAELTYNPIKKVEMNLGAGIDMVNDDAFINPVAAPGVGTTSDASNVYEYNTTTYTNIKYSLSKELQVGLEYQYFKTEWVDGSKGDANRIMSAVIYKF